MGVSPEARVEGRMEVGEPASPGQFRPQLQQEGVKLDSKEQYHQDGDLPQVVSKTGLEFPLKDL